MDSSKKSYTVPYPDQYVMNTGMMYIDYMYALNGS